jgi:uncharacterized membrane protein YqaE (UPF0057 family)
MNYDKNDNDNDIIYCNIQLGNEKKHKKLSRQVLLYKNYEKFKTHLDLNKYKKYKILINNIILNPNTYSKIHKYITYTKFINIEIIPQTNGGFIGELFSAIINLFKLLAFIPRIAIFIANLLVWLVKFLYYILNTLGHMFDPNNIVLSITYICGEVLLTPFALAFNLIKRFANNFGNMLTSALVGTDNVIHLNDNEPTEFHQKSGMREKCYRTSDGLVPFSVVIATVLCPPVGVFMEYGLTGILNIVICAVLTLAFYFPGLIYALILLYC